VTLYLSEGQKGVSELLHICPSSHFDPPTDDRTHKDAAGSQTVLDG